MPVYHRNIAMAAISAQRGAFTSSKQASRARPSRQLRTVVRAEAASSQSSAATISRRQLLEATLLPALLPVGSAVAAKAPKGFNPYEDRSDGYKFLYPFGWQEVAVKGTDIVFKDIVEPLESVSVTLTKTDKKDITEFGEIQEVADTLARNVLTSPSSEVKVLSTNKRDLDGHNYYEFEFTVSNSRYTRHQLAVVAAANDTFYTLTTGANEKRWNKIKDRLETTVRSFTVTPRV